MKAAFIALFFILAVLALGAFAEGEGAVYVYKLSLTKKLEDTVLDNDDHFFGLNSGKALTALRAVVAKTSAGLENYVSALEHRLDKKSFDLTVFAVPSIYSKFKDNLDDLHKGSDEFIAELNKELTDAEKAVAEFDSLGKASVTVYKAECFDGDAPKTTDECFPLATGCEEDKECPNFSKCVQCNVDDDCEGDKTCNVEEGTCVDPTPEPEPEPECNDTDKPCAEGQVCTEGKCEPEPNPEPECNDTDKPCAEGQVCTEGKCEPEPNPEPEPEPEAFQLAADKSGVCQKKKAANSSAVASVMVTLAMTVAMVALMIA